MEDLVRKIGHRLPEISDRAVNTLYSKLTHKLIQLQDLLFVDNAAACGLLLYWINERQTSADHNTIAACLKLLLECAKNATGHRALSDLGGVEFLNGYLKHCPDSLKGVVAKIIEALVSPDFEPIPRFIPSAEESYETYNTEPMNASLTQNTQYSKYSKSDTLNLKDITLSSKPDRCYSDIFNMCQTAESLPRTAKSKETLSRNLEDVKYTIIQHSEFPPVMLSESDEKILFDLCVMLKFGSYEDTYASLNMLQNRVFADFPIDTLLQRTDVIKSLGNLCHNAACRKEPSLSVKTYDSMIYLMNILANFASSVSKAEFRPVSAIARRAVIPAEYLEISHPSLKIEQWAAGTPGPTLSLLSCVELILNASVLDNVDTLGNALRLWENALWAVPNLVAHGEVVRNLFEKLGYSISVLIKKNILELKEGRLYIESILNLCTKIISSLEVSKISEYLSKDSKILSYLWEYNIFSNKSTDILLPYLQQIDSSSYQDFLYAQKCEEALNASIKLKETLILEHVVPITSIGMYYNALEFFPNVLPAFEFDLELPLPSAILDLNCYGMIIKEDSTMDARLSVPQGLLLALLNCPIEAISQKTVDVIKASLESHKELGGIGRGAVRREIVRKVLMQDCILAELIYKENVEILVAIVERNEDYEALVPYLTYLQALVNKYPILSGIIHLICNRHPELQQLKYLRDLFSKNNTIRAMAASVLRTADSQESLTKLTADLPHDYWKIRTPPDPIKSITEPGELNSIPLPKPYKLQESDIENLMQILRSKTIEQNLKISAYEQFIIHLLCQPKLCIPVIDELIKLCGDIVSSASDQDIIQVKLLSKALEICVIISLNYESYAKRILNSDSRFLFALVPGIFSEYGQVKYYSLYLLFILLFSHNITRNRFLPGYFTYIPSIIEDRKLKKVSILEKFSEYFVCPFEVSEVKCVYSEENEWKRYWDKVPVSDRIRSYVTRAAKEPVDSLEILNQLHRNLNAAERHSDIQEVVDKWANLVLISDRVDTKLKNHLIKPDTGFFSTMMTILRVPPTNKAEDLLTHHLLNALLRIIDTLSPSSSLPDFEFLHSITDLTKRNLLPFLTELTHIETRNDFVFSILKLLNKLLPFHGLFNSSKQASIQVLNRFQLEPSNQSSLLSLLSRLMHRLEDFSILSSLLECLNLLFDNEQLLISLDIKGSPVSQQLLSNISSMILEKLTPFATTTNFNYKGVVKRMMKFLVKIPQYVVCDSYVWCMRLAEDRESSVRMLAWALMYKKAPDVYERHPSIVETALEVCFALPECYGVKTSAISLLCGVLEWAINQEDVEIGQEILRELYKYGVLSQIKNLLYENSGPPACYFTAACSLLSSIFILDSSQVSSICCQLDIWDAIIRLLRPGSISERIRNERRTPLKAYAAYSYSETLMPLIYLLNFTSSVIKQDSQVSDYLIDSTHILSYILEWLTEILDNFDDSRPQIYNQAVISLLTCLHCCIYNSSGKAKSILAGCLDYSVIADVMDKCVGYEVKLCAARMLTVALPLVEIGNPGERILVHLVALFKEVRKDKSLAEHREVVNALASLLYYSQDAKIIAIRVGLLNELSNSAMKLLNILRAEYIQKTKHSDAQVKDLLQLLLLFKLWGGNSEVKSEILLQNNGPSPALRFFFAYWQAFNRHSALQQPLLKTLCTLISGSDSSKRACVLNLEAKQSMLSSIIEFASKPGSVDDETFRLALLFIGSLSASREARLLMVKSKYPQGLSQRLVKVWNECKDPTSIPVKSPEIIEFLSTLSFYEEAQKVLVADPGLIPVLTEVIDRFSSSLPKSGIVTSALLLLRNLCFNSSSKAHVLASPSTLPLILACISSHNQKPFIRRLAGSALWALLYNNQKVKGILSQQAVISELTGIQEEISRDLETLSKVEAKEETVECLSDLSECLMAVIKICIDP